MKEIKSYVTKKGEHYSLTAFQRKRTSFAWIVVDSLCILLMSTVVQFNAGIIVRLQHNAHYTAIFKA